MTDTATQPEAKAPEVQTPGEEFNPAPATDVEALFRSLDEPAPEALAPEPESEADAEPAPEEPAEAESAEEPEEQTEEPEQPAAKSPRFRINPARYEGRPAELEVIRLIDQDGYSLADAVRKVEQKHGVKIDMAPSPAKAEEAGKEPATPAAPTVESLQSEIDALEAEAEKAANDEFDLGKVRRLDKQIAAKTREMEALRQQAQSAQQTETQRFEADETESLRRCATLFPQLLEDENDFLDAVDDEIARRERINPGFRQRDPEWMEDVSFKVANKLGVAPAVAPSNGNGTPARGVKPASKPSAASAPVVPRPAVKARPATPAPAAGSSARPETTPSAEAEWQTVKDRMRQGDLEAGFAYLAAGGA